MDVHTLRRIAARAIRNGGTILNRFTVEWDISGRCRSSITREHFARTQIPREQKNQRQWSSDTPGAGVFRVILHTRCRKCDMCLRNRGNHWRGLAQRELLVAPRTWFVTLTLAPHSHFIHEQRAIERLAKAGTDFNKLSELEKFRERDREIYPDIQKWLKRIRKATGTRFRYLCVGEIHTEKQRGYPHYHLLLHEIIQVRPVTKREIQDYWVEGFSKVKLVESNVPHAHWYVTKYLTKEASTRVRASFRYGHGPTLSKHKNSRGGGTGEPLAVPPICIAETDYSVERNDRFPLSKNVWSGLEDVRDTLGPKKKGN